MIKTIIFDIGGVLVGYNWKEYLLKRNNNDEELVERLRANIFKNWSETDRGVLTEEELLASFTKDAPELKDKIYDFWENVNEALWQYDFTKDWLKELKDRGYQLLFLSNWSDHMFKFCSKQLDFLPMMDGGVFSYRVKLIKPDHAIYEEIIRKYNLIPSECVFLDDKLENCTAAKECGLNAVQVINHQVAVEGLEKLLSGSEF